MRLRLWLSKVHSGSLQLVVFIGVLIALLLSGLMLLSYSHHFFLLQSKNIVENIRLSETAIQYIAFEDQDLTLGSVKGLEDANHKVEISQSFWGIFDKVTATVKSRGKAQTRIALLGSKEEKEERPALYLQDHDQPLTVAGNTNISGKAYLPAQGIKAGNINGDGFFGNAFIKGATMQSGKSLPEINGRINDYFLDLLNAKYSNNAIVMPISQLKSCDNSFEKKTVIFNSESPIILDDIRLQGNIMIRSSAAIRVTDKSVLHDIILLAPVITLDDNVTGNFQSVTSRQIRVGKNCNLSYPSALIVTADKKNNIDDDGESSIFIDTGTMIRGSVCFLKWIKGDNFKSQVVFEKGARLLGEIYCTANLSLEGKVSGSVYTSQFIVNKDGKIYTNHLYGAEINSGDLPESYCGIIFRKGRKGIAKWMY